MIGRYKIWGGEIYESNIWRILCSGFIKRRSKCFIRFFFSLYISFCILFIPFQPTLVLVLYIISLAYNCIIALLFLYNSIIHTTFYFFDENTPRLGSVRRHTISTSLIKYCSTPPNSSLSNINQSLALYIYFFIYFFFLYIVVLLQITIFYSILKSTTLVPRLFILVKDFYCHFLFFLHYLHVHSI